MTLDEIEAKIEAFCAKWPNAEFGPAHIVLSDYNLNDGSVTWCISLISGCLSGALRAVDHSGNSIMIERYLALHSREELIDTLIFLTELLRIPEDVRDFPSADEVDWLSSDTL